MNLPITRGSKFIKAWEGPGQQVGGTGNLGRCSSLQDSAFRPGEYPLVQPSGEQQVGFPTGLPYSPESLNCRVRQSVPEIGVAGTRPELEPARPHHIW